jgi:hypothetical protein
VLFAILVLVAYRRDRWRSINVTLVAVLLTAIVEAKLIFLVSVLAPNTGGK